MLCHYAVLPDKIYLLINLSVTVAAVVTTNFVEVLLDTKSACRTRIIWWYQLSCEYVFHSAAHQPVRVYRCYLSRLNYCLDLGKVSVIADNDRRVRLGVAGRCQCTSYDSTKMPALATVALVCDSHASHQVAIDIWLYAAYSEMHGTCLVVIIAFSCVC